MSEIIRRFLKVCEENAILNSMISVDAQALQREYDLQKDRKGPLSGKLIIVKDNISVKDLPCSCGSRFLENYIAPYDAHVIERIREAGGMIAGKSNMDEFAMGSSTENSAFGPTLNPINPDYVPGGSSGGSAVAVAAGLSDYALGSDTGGSIRQPASFCGVVGLKPSYGRVSRYGLAAYASSMDQIGTITRTVRQSAELLQVIAGKDTRDAGSSDKAVDDYLSALESDDVKSVGIPSQFLKEGLDPEVRASFDAAVDILKNQGKKILDVDLPNLKYAVAVYYILVSAEASSNLARLDGIRYGMRQSGKSDSIDAFYSEIRGNAFGAEVKRRILLGTYILSSGNYDKYYIPALKLRRLISEDFSKAFRKADVLLLPTSPLLPFKVGEHRSDTLSMYLSDIYTVPLNIAGIPGISVPGGYSEQGLPIGIQLLGNHFEESRILQTAQILESYA